MVCFFLAFQGAAVLLISAILMLVASSLLADFDQKCTDEEKPKDRSRCSQLTAGTVSFAFKGALLRYLHRICMFLRFSV